MASSNTAKSTEDTGESSNRPTRGNRVYYGKRLSEEVDDGLEDDPFSGDNSIDDKTYSPPSKKTCPTATEIAAADSSMDLEDFDFNIEIDEINAMKDSARIVATVGHQLQSERRSVTNVDEGNHIPPVQNATTSHDTSKEYSSSTAGVA